MKTTCNTVHREKFHHLKAVTVQNIVYLAVESFQSGPFRLGRLTNWHTITATSGNMLQVVL